MMNSGNQSMLSSPHKGSKRKKHRHKNKGNREPNSEALRDQPVPESFGAVPCEICGHPVDPKRMHFHMVRFHGASFRTKRG
jgi:hypothetical protein